MIGRATFILSLANIANCFQTGSSRKIDLRQQFVIWWAGLVRGAVTIALSYEKVLGSMTKPLIQAMLSQHLTSRSTQDADLSNLEDIQCALLEHGNGGEYEWENHQGNQRGSLRLLMMFPAFTIHCLWRKFDDKYMRPVFGGRGFVPHFPGSSNAA